MKRLILFASLTFILFSCCNKKGPLEVIVLEVSYPNLDGTGTLIRHDLNADHTSAHSYTLGDLDDSSIFNLQVDNGDYFYLEVMGTGTIRRDTFSNFNLERECCEITSFHYYLNGMRKEDKKVILD